MSFMFLSRLLCQIVVVAWPCTAEHNDRQGPLGCSKCGNNLCGDERNGLSALVTGAGGSGTHSISELFQSNGLDLPHENVGKDGSVSWPYSVNVSESAPHWSLSEPCGHSPYYILKAPGVTFRNIFHVVRCPIDTISSMLSHDQCSMQYLKETLQMDDGFARRAEDFKRSKTELPVDNEANTTVFLANSWLKLNQHLEKSTTKRYRLDEFSQLFSDVCHAAGRNKEECANANLPLASRNHRSHATLTWAKMRRLDKDLAAKLYAKAVAYGFGEDCLGDHTAAASYLRKNTEHAPTHVNCDAWQCLDEDGILWTH